jgi:TRAP-type mannitol/chloroaromatic compound transport system permease small subunit
MSSLRKILKFIDTVSEASGWVAKWFALVLVFAGTYEAVSRHFFNAPTEWAYDVLCMAGGTLYLLGASYDYLHEAHWISFLKLAFLFRYILLFPGQNSLPEALKFPTKEAPFPGMQG